MHIVVLVDVVLKFIVRVESAFYSLDSAHETFDDIFDH